MFNRQCKFSASDGGVTEHHKEQCIRMVGGNKPCDLAQPKPRKRPYIEGQ